MLVHANPWPEVVALKETVGNFQWIAFRKFNKNLPVVYQGQTKKCGVLPANFCLACDRLWSQTSQ